MSAITRNILKAEQLQIFHGTPCTIGSVPRYETDLFFFLSFFQKSTQRKVLGTTVQKELWGRNQ
jgi:hypothetical protein